LEQLVLPPVFYLPPARVAHTRHAMPTNVLARNYKPSNAEKKAGKYQGDPTIVFDTFVVVNRTAAILIRWPDASLSDSDSTALCRLTDNLTSLGRAEGWVHAEVANGLSVEWNCVPAAVTSAGQELVSVFCPDLATAFSDEHYPPRPDTKKLKKGLKPSESLFDCPRWHLCLDTEIIHAERWPQVPGARWVSYVRPADAFTRAVAPAARLSHDVAKPTVARLLFDGPVLPLVSDTVRVAEAFRRAVMSRFEAWCRKHPAEAEPFRRHGSPDRFASPVLSGKDRDGRALLGHRHAHYLPTADGIDPNRVTHLTVIAADGFGPGEVAALAGLRSLRYTEGDPLRVQLVGLGVPADFRHALFGPARVWRSTTPFVGPPHVGQDGRARFLRKALRREVRRAAERDRLPEEVAAAVRAEALEPPVGSPRPFEFRRGRARPGDDGYRRACDLFRLTFPVAVTGPFCLGYANHYGLGLFVAVE
jgi:CRISPR-associated protein Csb2